MQIYASKKSEKKLAVRQYPKYLQKKIEAFLAGNLLLMGTPKEWTAYVFADPNTSSYEKGLNFFLKVFRVLPHCKIFFGFLRGIYLRIMKLEIEKLLIWTM